MRERWFCRFRRVKSSGSDGSRPFKYNASVSAYSVVSEQAERRKRMTSRQACEEARLRFVAEDVDGRGGGGTYSDILDAFCVDMMPIKHLS
jgi:hypothetical protein